MQGEFHVELSVPVADEAAAAAVVRRLQWASTAQNTSGAWVARRREGEPFTGRVRIDFTIRADTGDDAWLRALEWTRAELGRSGVGATLAGVAIPGVGEPAGTVRCGTSPDMTRVPGPEAATQVIPHPIVRTSPDPELPRR